MKNLGQITNINTNYWFIHGLLSVYYTHDTITHAFPITLLGASERLHVM